MPRLARIGAMLVVCALPAAGLAQVVPVAPASVIAPRADSLKTPPPTFVADTARREVVVSAEPPTAVTRRSAWRIGAAIVFITLTTLLLYNVRSR